MGKSDGRTYDEVNADYKDVCAKFGNPDKVAFSSRIMKCLNLQPYQVKIMKRTFYNVFVCRLATIYEMECNTCMSFRNCVIHCNVCQ